MLELLEKAVMTTIGVAAITQKKAEELVAEMKERFKLSEDEGKNLVDRILTIAKESREKVGRWPKSKLRRSLNDWVWFPERSSTGLPNGFRNWNPAVTASPCSSF